MSGIAKRLETYNTAQSEKDRDLADLRARLDEVTQQLHFKQTSHDVTSQELTSEKQERAALHAKLTEAYAVLETQASHCKALEAQLLVADQSTVSRIRELCDRHSHELRAEREENESAQRRSQERLEEGARRHAAALQRSETECTARVESALKWREETREENAQYRAILVGNDTSPRHTYVSLVSFHLLRLPCHRGG